MAEDANKRSVFLIANLMELWSKRLQGLVIHQPTNGRAFGRPLRMLLDL
jgi:hypothetical protein